MSKRKKSTEAVSDLKAEKIEKSRKPSTISASTSLVHNDKSIEVQKPPSKRRHAALDVSTSGGSEKSSKRRKFKPDEDADTKSTTERKSKSSVEHTGSDKAKKQKLKSSAVKSSSSYGNVPSEAADASIAAENSSASSKQVIMTSRGASAVSTRSRKPLVSPDWDFDVAGATLGAVKHPEHNGKVEKTERPKKSKQEKAIDLNGSVRVQSLSSEEAKGDLPLEGTVNDQTVTKSTRASSNASIDGEPGAHVEEGFKTRKARSSSASHVPREGPPVKLDDPDDGQQKSTSKQKKPRTTDGTSTEADDPSTAAGYEQDEGKRVRKKRKRHEVQEGELEIDVSRPEPPSKKALRKAKKHPAANDSIVIEEGTVSTSGNAYTTETTAGKSTNTAEKFGIWIGNLPWAADKKALTDWFVTNSSIAEKAVTRVHMPLPDKSKATKTALKPHNKGFAYVDFATRADQVAAIALSETSWNHRPVLIKDAKDFQGRPEQKTTTKKAENGQAGSIGTHKPNRRVCIKNLDFGMTEEDLKAHFQQCGEVEKLQLATFEDTGQCRGFAFVMFEQLEAAEAAVRGWLKVSADKLPRGSKRKVSAGDANKPQKLHKLFVNKIRGRDVHCEYAEDPTTRYEKRFGKAKTSGKKSHASNSAPSVHRKASPTYEPYDDSANQDTNDSSLQKSEAIVESDAALTAADAHHGTKSIKETPASVDGNISQAYTPMPMPEELLKSFTVPPPLHDADPIATVVETTATEAPKTPFARIVHRVVKSNKRLDDLNDKSDDARKARAKAKLDALEAKIGYKTGMIVEAKGAKITFDA